MRRWPTLLIFVSTAITTQNIFERNLWLQRAIGKYKFNLSIIVNTIFIFKEKNSFHLKYYTQKNYFVIPNNEKYF